MEFHFYPGRSVGKIRPVNVDRGLFEASPRYRKLLKDYIEAHFPSELEAFRQAMDAVENFWTKGEESEIYGFTDFVMEMKTAGVVLEHGPMFCVLSEPLHEVDTFFTIDVLEEIAERLRKIMCSVDGLNSFTIDTEDAGTTEVDGVFYVKIRMTMRKKTNEDCV